MVKSIKSCCTGRTKRRNSCKSLGKLLDSMRCGSLCRMSPAAASYDPRHAWIAHAPSPHVSIWRSASPSQQSKRAGTAPVSSKETKTSPIETEMFSNKSSKPHGSRIELLAAPWPSCTDGIPTWVRPCVNKLNSVRKRLSLSCHQRWREAQARAKAGKPDNVSSQHACV